MPAGLAVPISPEGAPTWAGSVSPMVAIEVAPSKGVAFGSGVAVGASVGVIRACWKMPRQGHIGFMASDIRPKQGDVVELRDTVHGILLDRKAVSAPG